MPPSYEQALVLRTYEFSENSQVAHLFTLGLGRVHGIAKGARRLNGAFHGGLDALALGRLGLYGRRPGAGLRTLASFATKTNFPAVRLRLGRFRAAEHVRAIVLAFTLEEQPLPELFELTVSALRLIEVSDDPTSTAVALGFESMVLALSGFAPELTRCVRCERPARNVVRARLAASRGGLLCRACRGEAPGAPEVSGRTVASLVALSEGPIVRAQRLPLDPTLRREIRRALTHWSEYVLDRPLPSRRTLT